MKRFIISLCLLVCVSFACAQEQEYNAKYLAEFTCYQFVLNDSFLNEEILNIQHCAEGFLLAYNKQSEDEKYAQVYGPIFSYSIGRQLVSSIDQYNGCKMDDYCSEQTLEGKNAQSLFNNRHQIKACRRGYNFFKDMDNPDFLSFKDALNEKIYFLNEKESSQSASFSQGSWQAYKCLAQ